MSKPRLILLLTALFLLGVPSVLLAVSKKACLVGSPEIAGGDFEQLRTLRSVVDQECQCTVFDGTKGHQRADYLTCTKRFIKEAVDSSRLRSSCQSHAKNMFSGSTCGQPPALAHAVCIKRQEKSGKLACTIKPTRKKTGASVASCVGKPGTVTAVSCPGFTHCIDAADTNGDLLIASPGDTGLCRMAPTATPVATRSPAQPTPTASPSPTPTATASPTPTASPDLPPDPGEAGKATLEGIDSDGDGLRDDLQRYIALTYPGNLGLQKRLRDVAITIQQAILEADDKEEAFLHANELLQAFGCLENVIEDLERRIEVMEDLQAAAANTEGRLDSWLKHNDRVGGRVFARCSGEGCCPPLP